MALGAFGQLSLPGEDTGEPLDLTMRSQAIEQGRHIQFRLEYVLYFWEQIIISAYICLAGTQGSGTQNISEAILLPPSTTIQTSVYRSGHGMLHEDNFHTNNKWQY